MLGGVWGAPCLGTVGCCSGQDCVSSPLNPAEPSFKGVSRNFNNSVHLYNDLYTYEITSVRHDPSATMAC